MDRRTFVGGLTAGTLASLPGWLSIAFASGSGPGSEPTRSGLSEGAMRVVEAVRTARRKGKPLLVFVIPSRATLGAEPDSSSEDPFQSSREESLIARQRSAAGVLFGEIFSASSDETFALLALCTPVAATLEELRQGDLPQIPESAWVAVLETPADTARANLLSWSLPDDSRTFDQLVAGFGAELKAILAPDAARLMERAEQSHRTLSSLIAKITDAMVAQGWCPDETLLLAASARWLALAARCKEEERTTRTRCLALAMKARLREAPPGGTAWMHDQGCGEVGSGYSEEAPSFGCGMAHVSRESTEFLGIYARTLR